MPSKLMSKMMMPILLMLWSADAWCGPWVHRYPGPEKPQLCGEMQSRLNLFAHRKVEPDICTFEAMASSPKLRRPPWQALETQEHILLIARLLRYRDAGASNYGAATSDEWLGEYMTKARVFASEGGQVRRTTLLFHGPAHSVERTVVQLSERADKGPVCLSKKSDRRMHWHFIVDANLSGPDQSTTAATAAVVSYAEPFLDGSHVAWIAPEEVYFSGSDGLYPACSFIRTE